MGKKKGKADDEKPSGSKPNRSPSHTVYARLPVELGEALEAYINSLRPKPTATSVLQTFIEDGLKAAGFWPPPDQADAGDEGGA